MTIFTSKLGEKKDRENVLPVDDISVHVDSKETDSSASSNVEDGEVQVRARRKHPMLNLCVFVLGVVILAAAFVGVVSLYKHLAHAKYQQYDGFCGVRYHEQNDPRALKHLGMSGEFEQQVEIDGDYEKLKVPSLGETSSATVLHDFNMNMTAIVDVEQEHCLLLPLNRTLVLPPRDFWDLLEKLKSGYYMPDAEVLMKNYHAVLPPVHDVTQFGAFITDECQDFETFLLVPDTEPLAMSKRSACNLSGKQYCLGDTGTKKMVCIKINRCT